jgi:hypothetical protein
VALLLLIGFTALVTILLIRPSGFFRVEATTERLEITLRDTLAAERADLFWVARGDSVEVNGQIIGSFTGHFAPGAGTRVVVRRTGSGPVELEIYAPSAADVAAVLYDEHDEEDRVIIARGFFALKAQPAADRSDTFPYFGTATVGDVLSSAGSDLLLEGSVSILGSTVLGSDRFVAGAVPLRMGDAVSVTGRVRCTDQVVGAPGVGVARVGGEPAISVVHEARGRALRIGRAGASAPHCFRPSLWSFLSADPLVGGLLLFAAGVLIAVAQNVITLTLMGGAGLTHVGRGRLPGRPLDGLPMLPGGRTSGKI